MGSWTRIESLPMRLADRRNGRNSDMANMLEVITRFFPPCFHRLLAGASRSAAKWLTTGGNLMQRTRVSISAIQITPATKPPAGRRDVRP